MTTKAAALSIKLNCLSFFRLIFCVQPYNDIQHVIELMVYGLHHK